MPSLGLLTVKARHIFLIFSALLLMPSDLIVNENNDIVEVRANTLAKLADETKTIETKKWVVAFTVIVAVVTIVPIIPIALAFLAGAVINNRKRSNQNGKKN